MKFLLLLFLPLTLSAQVDSDFTFQPADAQGIYRTYQVTDSTTKAVSWKSDSTQSKGRCIVQKSGNLLSIMSLVDIAKPNYLYQSPMLFVGATKDGACLVYEGNNGEIVFINPALGFVIIRVYSHCQDPKTLPKDVQPRCDTQWFTFGNPPKGYRP